MMGVCQTTCRYIPSDGCLITSIMLQPIYRHYIGYCSLYVMNETTLPFLRDLFPLEWKMLFSYIEHRTDSWNRNLEVLRTES